MSVSPYADAVLKSNPSYYWRLGEKTGTTAFDSVGGANGDNQWRRHAGATGAGR